ncbi:MAG: hypothetical protein WCF84_19135, partial [Anaerolineae bacterium]
FFFLGEDVDLCWRLHAAGWKIYYVPQAVVTHLWGGSRVRLSEQMSLLAQRAQVLLFRKHRPGAPAHVVTGVAYGLTLLKGCRRVLGAWLRGDRAAASSSWRMHREEWAWLSRR